MAVKATAVGQACNLPVTAEHVSASSEHGGSVLETATAHLFLEQAPVRHLPRLDLTRPQLRRFKRAVCREAASSGFPPCVLIIVFSERYGASPRLFSPSPAASAVPLTLASNTDGGEPEDLIAAGNPWPHGTRLA